jgi:hypothetical protein
VEIHPRGKQTPAFQKNRISLPSEKEFRAVLEEINTRKYKRRDEACAIATLNNGSL